MSNVFPLFAFNTLATTPAEIAAVLRQLADNIENYEHDVQRVVVLLDDQGMNMDRFIIGRPGSRLEYIGLLEWFKSHELR